jgi:TPR repeat protein
MSCLCDHSVGTGTDLDLEEANRWFAKAAEKGDVDAQNSLGSALFSGRGIAKDLKLAFYWFLRAAEGGLATAQSNVVSCSSSLALTFNSSHYCASTKCSRGFV